MYFAGISDEAGGTIDKQITQRRAGDPAGLLAGLDQHRPAHSQRPRAGVRHADDDEQVPEHGLPLAEVIARSTVAPAREIGQPELGTLSVGSEADVAVFDLKRGASRSGTAAGRSWGSQRLVCKYTLRAGQVVHNPEGWGYPEWEQAPAPYWVNPALQVPS